MPPPANILDIVTINETDGKSIMVVMPSPTEYSFNADDWAQQITKVYPGPYPELVIDLSRYRTVNSILCAGFIHLYRQYHCEQATLRNVSSNVEGILKTLQLDKIFNLQFQTQRYEKDS